MFNKLSQRYEEKIKSFWDGCCRCLFGFVAFLDTIRAVMAYIEVSCQVRFRLWPVFVCLIIFRHFLEEVVLQDFGNAVNQDGIHTFLLKQFVYVRARAAQLSGKPSDGTSLFAERLFKCLAEVHAFHCLGSV